MTYYSDIVQCYIKPQPAFLILISYYKLNNMNYMKNITLIVEICIYCNLKYLTEINF